MKKQTAVEWLIEQMEKQCVNVLTDAEIEQAKQMEKQQIIDAHGSKLRNSRGVTNYEYWYNGEDYYNETFKSKLKDE